MNEELAETQSPKLEGRDPKTESGRHAGELFGIRISTFLRVSDLGFRISPAARALAPTPLHRPTPLPQAASLSSSCWS